MAIRYHEDLFHKVRHAGDALLEAFSLGRDSPAEFFREGFDRLADPCLEGRYGRLTEFIERKSTGLPGDWEDFSYSLGGVLSGMSSSPAVGGAAGGSLGGTSVLAAPAGGAGPRATTAPSIEDIIGEHIRVFTNRCLRDSAGKLNADYGRAKDLFFRYDEGMDVLRAPAREENGSGGARGSNSKKPAPRGGILSRIRANVVPGGGKDDTTTTSDHQDLQLAKRIAAEMRLRCNARTFEPYVLGLKRHGDRSLEQSSTEDIRTAIRKHVEWVTLIG